MNSRYERFRELIGWFPLQCICYVLSQEFGMNLTPEQTEVIMLSTMNELSKLALETNLSATRVLIKKVWLEQQEKGTSKRVPEKTMNEAISWLFGSTEDPLAHAVCLAEETHYEPMTKEELIDLIAKAKIAKG